MIVTRITYDPRQGEFNIQLATQHTAMLINANVDAFANYVSISYIYGKERKYYTYFRNVTI